MSWTSAIGPTISALGGLLGGGSAGKDMRDQRVQNEKATKRHPKNVRIGAERAGFNPLTYLLANGSPASVNALATGTPLASWDALGQAVDAFVNPAPDETADALQQSARRQLDRVERDQSWFVRKWGPGLQRVVDAPLAVPAPGPNNVSASRVVAAQTEQHNPWGLTAAASDEGGLPPEKPLMVFGLPLKPQANTSDAEMFEARYGEIGGEIVGGPALMWDMYQAGLSNGYSVQDAQPTKTVPTWFEKETKAREADEFWQNVRSGNFTSPTAAQLDAWWLKQMR